jgi:tellurite resistance protein
MSEITFASLQPNIASVQAEGSMVHVVFQCPVSGQQLEARAGMRRGTDMGARAKQTAKRSMMQSLRRSVSSAIRGAFGYGMLGRVGQDLANSAMRQLDESTRYSSADQEAAVVRAFESVRSQFAWDAREERWILGSAAQDTLSGFSAQLASHPVTERYDLGVMARLLTEIASADGEVDDDERSFLIDFLPSDVGTVDQLVGRPPLSAVELSETSEGPHRKTMVMLGWTVAFCDDMLDSSEAERMGAVVSALELSASDAAEAKALAQRFVVDQAIETAHTMGGDARMEAIGLAKRIGMDPTEAERAEIRFRKRMGYV